MSEAPQISFSSALAESPFLWLLLLLATASLLVGLLARDWRDGAVATTLLCVTLWCYEAAVLMFTYGLPLSSLETVLDLAPFELEWFVGAFAIGRLIRFVYSKTALLLSVPRR
jgi:hypothetical protein